MDDNLKKSNPTPTSQKSEIWELESGKWQQESSGLGFKLVETNTGQKVSSHLTNADLQVILNLPKHPDTDKEDWLYPPEFKYCTETREELRRQDLSDEKAWIPPFGVLPINERADKEIIGLNQNQLFLNTSNLYSLSVDDSDDINKIKIDLPPGNFHFFSIKCSSESNLLIRYDPKLADISVFCPVTKAWKSFESKDIRGLAISEIESELWGCESFVDGNSTKLFLPTNKGLAQVDFDAASLIHDVQYYGNEKCIGSPIYFMKSIWVPIRDDNTGISLLEVALSNGKVISFDKKNVFPKNVKVTLTDLQKPIRTQLYIIWVCTEGQLILDYKNKEAEPLFIPWPEYLKPIFNLGCPFVSNEGSLYQICKDNSQNINTYVQLHDATFNESFLTKKIRICSGTVSFHYNIKKIDLPWNEIEESTSKIKELVIPLLEYAGTKLVIGLRINLDGGMTTGSILKSIDKRNVEVVFYCYDKEFTLFNFTSIRPWQVRFFSHDGVFYVYHPDLQSIIGWSLEK